MLLVVPLFPTSIPEADLNMLVLPLFLTLIPEAELNLVVLALFLTSILEADLMALVLPLNSMLPPITGPMVDVVEADSRTTDVEEAAYAHTVDASEYVFPTQGGTVRTVDVS